MVKNSQTRIVNFKFKNNHTEPHLETYLQGDPPIVHHTTSNASDAFYVPVLHN